MTRDPWLAAVRFGPDGLVPVVAQDRRSGDVLMLAWATREALLRTRETGRAHYWSRSRNTLWEKGESSGHTQRVHEIRVDCDGDTLLYRVDQVGPACHTGARTCFSTRVDADGGSEPGEDPGGHLLTRLDATIRRRAADRTPGSYTVTLLDHGIATIAQKVGEEAVEVVVAATAQDDTRLANEAADLLFHLWVLLRARGVEPNDVLRVLEAREK